MLTNKVFTCLTGTAYFLMLSAASQGALVIEISDAGGGSTRYQLSGSATIVSGGTGGNLNGIWVSNSQFTGTPFVGFAGGISPTSGTWTITTTLNGTSTLDDVYLDSGYGFAPRVSGSGVTYTNGNNLSWSGDFIVPIAITNYTIGTFSTNTIGVSGGTGTLDSPYTLIIGSAAAIPEPSTYIAIAGVTGLLGFVGLRRYRQHKNKATTVG